MAGYSKRSLVQKLGIKEGFAIAFVHARRDYRTSLGALPPGVTVENPKTRLVDFIQFFAVQKAEVERKLPALKRQILPEGMLWVSWPKGSSGIKTDLNENVIRKIALENGLVDVKVCAVDETWSALKLVYRLKDRHNVLQI